MINRTVKWILAITLLLPFLLTLTACSSMKIEDYADTKPQFDLYNYFAGQTRGWGMFQDRSGKVKRQFVVDITGTINANNELVLDEDFTWNDGEKSRRVWTIRKEGGQYIGTASDVVGEAIGKSAGNALNWQYDLNLPVGDKTYQVHFNDWMYLQDDTVLLNRATMSKFGFKLGEVFISFTKEK
jgi:hypothetical protein